MEIWPAIDLLGGKCVRLEQGDYSREKVFDDDPAAVARRWVDRGARQIHLVDLDAARQGSLVNGDSIRAILSEVDVPCQLGGGIRTETTIEQLLEIGVARLVLGTSALKRPDWFGQMCRKYPERLVLGIDARDGKVATEGWTETSHEQAIPLAVRFAEEPIAAIVYTDIATDGMLSGPNVEAMSEMARSVGVPVIASGGVTTVADVQQLAAIPLSGCIVGRSLYEGRMTLEDAIRAGDAT